MEKLTAKETLLLAELRRNHEGEIDGWGDVYLDNAKPAAWTAREFAGRLGSLEKKGFYRSQSDPEFKYAFGRVKLRA